MPRRSRASRGPHASSGLSWGYAELGDGTLVIRNWNLIVGWAILILCILFFSTMLAVQPDTRGLSVVGLFAALYFVWAFALECGGVRVGSGTLSYPVRLGSDHFAMPIFRRSIALGEVLQASGHNVRQGARIVYLSGEFGQAKVHFDTKGGRDRLFALLREHFPEVRVLRSS